MAVAPNEYLAIFNRKRGECDPFKSIYFVESVESRRQLTQQFAWAVPSPQALGLIAKYTPLVEMGAGTGYWAYLLKSRGADIIAYDKHPPGPENHWHQEGTHFTEVRAGTPQVLKNYSERTLFLCWPPYNEKMAYDSVKAWRGKTLIYIGEGGGGCTADDKFFEFLAKHFREIKSIDIPNWYGIHDRLEMYERLQ